MYRLSSVVVIVSVSPPMPTSVITHTGMLQAAFAIDVKVCSLSQTAAETSAASNKPYAAFARVKG